MTGAAIAGIAISAISTGMAIKDKADAKKAADDMIQPTPINPNANLFIDTVGGNFMGEQSQRTMATQTQALAGAGGRGLAFLPQVARQSALTDQQIAADYSRQSRENQMQYAQGEQYKNAQEIRQYNMEQQGYGQQYAAANQNIFSGINQGLGFATSGFSEGGVFNKNSSQQAPNYLPYQQAVSNFNSNAALYQTPNNVQPLTLQPLVAANNNR